MEGGIREAPQGSSQVFGKHALPACYWSLTESCRPLPSFYRVSPSCTGFHQVLLGFTGFYRVLPGFTGFYCAVTGFLPSFNQFYLVLPSFTGFYWVFIGFYRV